MDKEREIFRDGKTEKDRQMKEEMRQKGLIIQRVAGWLIDWVSFKNVTSQVREI